MRNTIVANLLSKPEEEKAINVVYSFICDCQEEYIGESECLLMRIRDHGQKSKDTAVHSHISNCAVYQTGFSEMYQQNNPKSRFENLKSKFTVLHKNLSYDKRKQMEGLEISLKDPSLNKQINHRKIFIL